MLLVGRIISNKHILICNVTYTEAEGYFGRNPLQIFMLHMLELLMMKNKSLIFSYWLSKSRYFGIIFSKFPVFSVWFIKMFIDPNLYCTLQKS